jgi:hypothetical protein
MYASPREAAISRAGNFVDFASPTRQPSIRCRASNSGATNAAGSYEDLAVARVLFLFLELPMIAFPGRLTAAAITAMSEDELLAAEFESHIRFLELDAAERRTKGAKYSFLHASENLMNAWDQWGRLLRAAQFRTLTPRRLPKSGAETEPLPVS